MKLGQRRSSAAQYSSQREKAGRSLQTPDPKPQTWAAPALTVRLGSERPCWDWFETLGEERERIDGLLIVGWLSTDDSRGLVGLQGQLSRWGCHSLKAGRARERERRREGERDAPP